MRPSTRRLQVISPWKDPEFLAAFKGRPDLLAYAEAHGIDVKASSGKPFSEDANLIHISHESGILEDPGADAGEGIFSWTSSRPSAPDAQTVVEITFKDGVPVKVEDRPTAWPRRIRWPCSAAQRPGGRATASAGSTWSRTASSASRAAGSTRRPG